MFWSQGSRHYSAARHSVKTDLFCAGSVCTVSRTVFLKRDLGTETILKFALKDFFYDQLVNIKMMLKFALKDCFYNPLANIVTILKFALKDCFYDQLANIMPTVRRFIAHKACFC